MIRVALFARVSTRKQNTDRQLYELRSEAVRQGWTVAAELTEIISGAKATDKRPELLALLELCRAGAVDKVMVSEISRLGRKVKHVLDVLDELTQRRISVFVHNHRLETLQEDGRPNPMVRMILMILAEFAATERELTAERAASGQSEAKRKGKHIGRPAGTGQDATATLARYPEVVTQLRRGKPNRDVAKLCNVSEGTVKKVRKLLA